MTSNAATVYRFTLKDLEATASKYGKKINTAKFLKELFDAFTLKRIVARRQAMGRYLELEGRRNMNYFYLESPSPISRPSRNSIKAINRSVTQAKTDRPKSAVKPRYHGLNFNEFLEQGQPQNNRAIRFSKE